MGGETTVFLEKLCICNPFSNVIENSVVCGFIILCWLSLWEVHHQLPTKEECPSSLARVTMTVKYYISALNFSQLYFMLFRCYCYRSSLMYCSYLLICRIVDLDYLCNSIGLRSIHLLVCVIYYFTTTCFLFCYMHCCMFVMMWLHKLIKW